MDPIIYACMIAGTLTLADRPCVDRGQDAPVAVTLPETPPRLDATGGVSPGSSFQVTGFDRRGRPVGYWVPAGRAVPYVHKHGRRGR